MVLLKKPKSKKFNDGNESFDIFWYRILNAKNEVLLHEQAYQAVMQNDDAVCSYKAYLIMLV